MEDLSERFCKESGLEECVMSPQLLIFLWMGVREMEAEMGNVDARLKINGKGWVMACLFADDTAVCKVERVVDEFYSYV